MSTAHRPARPPAPRAAQSGAGMIEVMVSVLVLAVGVLGIAAMQAAALRSSQSAYERSQGVVNTYSIIDAMRANRGDARAGTYNMSWTCTVPGGSGLVAKDQAFWLTSVQRNLGSSACGRIQCTSALCTIEVRWDDTRAKGEAQQTFSTQVAL